MPAAIIIWNPLVFPLSLNPLPYGPAKVKVFSAQELIRNLVKTPCLYSLMQNVKVELLMAVSMSFLLPRELPELLPPW